MNIVAALNAVHTLVWVIGILLICLVIFCGKYKGRGGTLATVIQAVNAVHTNVWCVVIIGLGVALIMAGHNAEGTQLSFGAFGVIKGSENPKIEPEKPKPQLDQQP